jgi:hypothetical protein
MCRPVVVKETNWLPDPPGYNMPFRHARARTIDSPRCRRLPSERKRQTQDGPIGSQARPRILVEEASTRLRRPPSISRRPSGAAKIRRRKSGRRVPIKRFDALSRRGSSRTGREAKAPAPTSLIKGRERSSSPKPVSRTRIQLGPPLSTRLLKRWRAQLFALEPLAPSGRNIDALQAIEAADKVFVRGPKAYVFAVRYGRMTNPHQLHPYSAGFVWVVMYQRDTTMARSCTAAGCPPTAQRGPYAQTNAVIDAKTGYAIMKFQT